MSKSIGLDKAIEHKKTIEQKREGDRYGKETHLQRND